MQPPIRSLGIITLKYKLKYIVGAENLVETSKELMLKS
jgi:hypothetical protein